jgi:predicted PhzF superfamily epimerase YddE/YHI9
VVQGTVQLRIFQVDAFTAEPFRGNPAAVCLLDGPRDDGWRQAVAAEMNLSETAFVERHGSGGGGEFALRWFTPTTEVDLCGHATLAAAHVLWEAGEAADRLSFRTRSGKLVAERVGPGIRLDFPSQPAAAVDIPAGLAVSLGAEPVWVGANGIDYLVELDNDDAVRSLTPDIAGLRALPVRGVIVTAAGADGCDFVSRFFAPATGIDEDPVTGSTHCCLGPYWRDRLGRAELVGYQASARGGYVGVRVAGDRVLISGQAVTVLRGELV